MALRTTFLVVAALLLAAHFLREGSLGLVALCFLTPLLLMIRRRWSLIVLQLLTYGAAAIWINTTIHLVYERIQLGRAWGGVVVILRTVALFTILTGLLLNSSVIREEYSRP